MQTLTHSLTHAGTPSPPPLGSKHRGLCSVQARRTIKARRRLAGADLADRNERDDGQGDAECGRLRLWVWELRSLRCPMPQRAGTAHPVSSMVADTDEPVATANSHLVPADRLDAMDASSREWERHPHGCVPPDRRVDRTSHSLSHLPERSQRGLREISERSDRLTLRAGFIHALHRHVCEWTSSYMRYIDT